MPGSVSDSYNVWKRLKFAAGIAWWLWRNVRVGDYVRIETGPPRLTATGHSAVHIDLVFDHSPAQQHGDDHGTP